MKHELKANLTETMYMFNMDNQDNIPSNIPPMFNSQEQAQDAASNNIDQTEANMFATNQPTMMN